MGTSKIHTWHSTIYTYLRMIEPNSFSRNGMLLEGLVDPLLKEGILILADPFHFRSVLVTNHLFDLLGIGRAKQLGPSQHGSDVVCKAFANLGMLSRVLDLLGGEFVSELWRQVLIDLAKVAEGRLASRFAACLHATKVEVARRCLQEGHFQMLGNGEIDGGVGCRKGVLAAVLEGSRGGSAIGIAEVWLQGTDSLFKRGRVADLEASNEDDTVVQHLLFNPRAVDLQTLGNKYNRIIPTRGEDHGRLVFAFQKADIDLIETKTGRLHGGRTV